ncbi:hypothetical protein HK104_001546 [Borealophlyctis nickersoniae]|nr:hypothetical protein HK104_001546 [Borealophlyctis nickersoniae]
MTAIEALEVAINALGITVEEAKQEIHNNVAREELIASLGGTTTAARPRPPPIPVNRTGLPIPAAHPAPTANAQWDGKLVERLVSSRDNYVTARERTLQTMCMDWNNRRSLHAEVDSVIPLDQPLTALDAKFEAKTVAQAYILQLRALQQLQQQLELQSADLTAARQDIDHANVSEYSLEEETTTTGEE